LEPLPLEPLPLEPLPLEPLPPLPLVPPPPPPLAPPPLVPLPVELEDGVDEEDDELSLDDEALLELSELAGLASDFVAESPGLVDE
jgi:hypothetical protein